MNERSQALRPNLARALAVLCDRDLRHAEAVSFWSRTYAVVPRVDPYDRLVWFDSYGLPHEYEPWRIAFDSPREAWEVLATREVIPRAWAEGVLRFKAHAWYGCPTCGGWGCCHPGCDPYLAHPPTFAGILSFASLDPARVAAVALEACERLVRNPIVPTDRAEPTWTVEPAESWQKTAVLLDAATRANAPDTMLDNAALYQRHGVFVSHYRKQSTRSDRWVDLAVPTLDPRENVW